MAYVSTETFAALLGRLDREEFARFVADLWAARGWETRIDDGTVEAVDPDRGRRLRLAVRPRPRWRARVRRRLGRRDRVPADADALVAAALDPDAPPGVRAFGAEDLRGMALYAVDLDARTELFVRHFGGPPETFEEPSARPATWTRDPGTDGKSDDPCTGRGRSGRRRASDRSTGGGKSVGGTAAAPSIRGLTTVAAALLLLGVALAPALPTPLAGEAGDDAGATPAATTDPAGKTGDATARTDVDRTATPGRERPLAPGLAADGTVNASRLARAHEEAIAERPYRWVIIHRQAAGDELLGVATETVNVRGPREYVSRVSLSGTFRAYPFPIASVERYADGNREHTRPVEMPVRYVSSPRADPPDDPNERGASLVEGYLASTHSEDVEAIRIRNRRYYRVTAVRPDDFWAENYTAVAVVGENGFVRYLRVSYDLAAAGNVSSVVIFGYDHDTVLVWPPAWYLGGNRSSSPASPTPTGRTPVHAEDAPTGTASTAAETAPTTEPSAADTPGGG